MNYKAVLICRYRRCMLKDKTQWRGECDMKDISVKRKMIIVASIMMLFGILIPSYCSQAATQQEALQWVKSKVGQSIDADGTAGAQCVDLILAYYDYLGVPRASGNAIAYSGNALPAGWSRFKDATPQPGDILVYTGGDNNYGHVAIFESAYSTYHQNFSGAYVEHVTGIAYNGFTTPYWGIIRPNFNTHTHTYTSSITKQPTCTATGIKTFRCSCGKSYTESVAAKGHNYASKKVQPTMTEKGYTLHTCSACGKSYKDNYINPPELKADGWYYCDTLPSGITSDKYTIAYNNYYEKIQKSSPGAGWTKAGTVKSEWQNSGSQYKSERDLPTSDARILVRSVYYHFCGPNAGAEGNYEQTGKFVHYDEIGAASVIVRSSGMDGTHPYYLLDWIDGGGRIRCASGVTCDGSFGSHGERCQAWYKMNTYQDRVKVEEYKYTKQSGWVSTKDKSAKSVKIRFMVKHTHSYTSEVIKQASCEKNGKKKFTCSCGDSYEQTILATGHTIVTEKAVAATCTVDGKTDGSHCSVCSKILKKAETVKATGHVYVLVGTNAGGTPVYRCSKCGKSIQENAAEESGKKTQPEGVETEKDTFEEDEEGDWTEELPDEGDVEILPSGTYIVIQSSNKVREVSLSTPALGKNRSYMIPDVIFINNREYKVTEIAPNAFKNSKKLKSVTIGKNIKRIGKNAFYGCKNLKKITVKSNVLKSVGKNAIKGTNKKLTIKVPKKKLSVYKKILKKKGNRKVKIKKR